MMAPRWWFLAGTVICTVWLLSAWLLYLADVDMGIRTIAYVLGFSLTIFCYSAGGALLWDRIENEETR